MTPNEKFRNVTGLSLDVEDMIAKCPVEEKEKSIEFGAKSAGFRLVQI